MKKEKWIEDVLQTATQIKPVASNPYLPARIEAISRQPGNSSVNVPLRWILASATAMILLVTMNILAWKNSERSSPDSSLQQLVNEYSFGGNDIYSMNYSN